MDKNKERADAIAWAVNKAADDLVHMKKEVGSKMDFANRDPFYTALDTRISIIFTGQILLNSLLEEDGSEDKSDN